MHMQTVPCSFRERLNKFTGKWLVAQSPRFRKFDLYLLKEVDRIIICGPYWKSLVRVYDIGVVDVVQFELDENPFEPVNNIFQLIVYSNGAKKNTVVDTGNCLLLYS
jgi:hypothetical protein